LNKGLFSEGALLLFGLFVKIIIMTIIKKEDWDRYFREGKDFSPVNDLFIEDFLNFLKSLGLKNIKYILDLGCGTGNFTVKLAKRGYRVKAVDYSFEAIKIAKEKAKKAGISNLIDFEINDIEKIEFEKEKYDLVILRLVYAFIKNKKRLLSKVKRSLSKKGWVLLETPVIFRDCKYSKDYKNIAVDYISLIKLLRKNFKNVILFDKQYTRENGLMLSLLLSNYKLKEVKDPFVKTIIQYSHNYLKTLYKR
jgi:2-polyprenyl-3-methyl-5-hydroxy-6-metoxy-1,4-benzoquinol methylase